MQILDVTISGTWTVPDGGVVDVRTVKVGWDGEWVEDGDVATTTAQRNEVIALFPDVEIQDVSIVPEPIAPEDPAV
jgi:hypothetical protein